MQKVKDQSKIDHEEFWQEFQNGATRRNTNGMPMVNAARNPLNPNEQNQSVLTINFQEIVDGLQEAQRIINAYKQLVALRGVGHKVASLLLRDLVMVSGSKYGEDTKQEDGDEVYWRLQPVDTWVDFVATQLNLYNSRVQGEINKAKAICERCIHYNVNPLKFNAGTWFVGSTVMRCKEQLRDILQENDDQQRALRLLRAGLEDDVFEREIGGDTYRPFRKNKYVLKVLRKWRNKLQS